MGMGRKSRSNNHQMKNRDAFHTVSVGEGKGPFIRTRAKLLGKSHRFMAVDPKYGEPGGQGKGQVVALQKAGILHDPRKIGAVLDDMLKKNVRVGEFHFNMPSWFVKGKKKPGRADGYDKGRSIRLYDYNRFFRKARDVLVLGGKIVIRSEQRELVSNIAEIAQKNGFKNARVVTETNVNQTFDMQRLSREGHTIWRLECTL
jgi:hypothetical protein